ncbi:MAG TPA: 50S ribosomal protein L3 N(5)-glutamine methyltransferase [Steroidobacteraceae bacterium]|nr:50S ribosomal protein L3 N(5)-glutamine methyltransferase [Steroidobacteraceae bacterium]
MREVSHTGRSVRAPATRATILRSAVTRLRRARLYYGHGTENARDDAAALLAHALRLRRPLEVKDLQGPLSRLAADRFEALLARRMKERLPVVYLTGRCWFAGLPFYVDQRVLIPRSPIAELIERRFAPWVDADCVRRIADLGTGSGCIALACAMAFPRAQVDAVDIDPAALAVARINREALRLARRVRVVKSDFFRQLGARRYDMIVSNPPYVGAKEYASLPPEYAHEPAAALLSGEDGMQAVRVLLRGALRHLTPQGVLIVEVGNTETTVQREFPHLPFTWLSFERGGGGVFLLTARQLRAARGSF